MTWFLDNWQVVAQIVVAVLGLIGTKKALQWRAGLKAVVGAVELDPHRGAKGVLKMQVAGGKIPKVAQSVLSIWAAGVDPGKKNPTLRQKIQVALLNKVFESVKL